MIPRDAHLPCRNEVPLFEGVMFDTDAKLGKYQQAAIHEAKTVCNTVCKFATDCLAQHGDDPYGVVGGMYASERRAIGIKPKSWAIPRTERADDRRGGDAMSPSDWLKNDGAA